MDKKKLFRSLLKFGALAGGVVVTMLTNKAENDEMRETVAKEVAEALANQAKES